MTLCVSLFTLCNLAQTAQVECFYYPASLGVSLS